MTTNQLLTLGAILAATAGDGRARGWVTTVERILDGKSRNLLVRLLMSVLFSLKKERTPIIFLQLSESMPA